MTLDEAIKHCLEVAENNEQFASGKWIGSEGEANRQECEQCAADHRQLAEWLTELKELRGLVAASNVLAKDVLAVDTLCKQILEYKRLLKLAVEDMYNSVNDVHCKYCSKWHTDQCQGTSHLDCYIENKFKWRYADEALKLIGEDGGNDDTITGS